MDGQWVSYQELGVRLGCTPEAARRRAIRGKWARMPGNDGRTRVLLPDELHGSCTPPVRTEKSALLRALEGHVASLKAENERQATQLAAAGECESQLRTELAAEKARVEKAIEAFSGLAERLDALAAHRPWWRRLVG